MKDEFTASENNGTYTLATLPLDKLALGYKWVYWVKYKADGTIEGYKALLVILDNTHTDDVDHT